MHAKVFLRSGEYFVGLTLNGLPHDEAGPFDEHEAVMMARRAVGAGNVRFLYGAVEAAETEAVAA